jgi:hypothetical protein
MVSELVGDVFGMLCFHPPQSKRCSNLVEGRIWAALPLLEREGDVAALSSRFAQVSSSRLPTLAK